MTDAVRLDREGPDGSVARVTLARPDTRNAIDEAVIAGLRDAFTSLADEPPARLRAVVLAGDGRSFCAGASVAWMQEAAGRSTEANEADARTFASMLALIDACPVPVVARVQGAALGGGAGLCAVADVVVAQAGAAIGFPEVRLGLVPATIAPFVVRRIGAGHARALFTTGIRIDAREAQAIGLVHRVVEGEEALDAAVAEVVSAILAGGAEAVRSAKALVQAVAGPRDDAVMSVLTARILAQRRVSDEAREGLRAFAERRPPAWAPPPEGGG